MTDVIYRVEVPFASFGMLVRDGVVVDVATVAYWARHKPVSEVLTWVQSQNGTWKIVSQDPLSEEAEFVDAYTSCMPSTPPEKAKEVYALLAEPKTEVRARLSQLIRAVRARSDKKNIPER